MRLVEARLHAQRLRLRGPALHASGPGIVRLAPRRHLGRDARAGAVAVRAIPPRPAADPRSPAGSADPRTRTSTRSRCARRRPRSCPASRRRSTATTASIPGRRSARAPGREVVVRQRNALPFEANVHLHGGYVPAAHDGHPMDVIAAGGSFEYHYPNEQDAREPLVPRPRARPHVAHAVPRPAGDVRARGRRRARARPSARRVRRAARDRRPRLQPRRLVPLRRERRPRLPRRHDPGQRRRLAAHARQAAQVPPAHPQRARTRARTRCGSAAAA